MSDPSLEVLDRALRDTGAIIAQVRPTQADAPTPCLAWTLRQLINHVVIDVQQFTSMARGGRYEASDADVIGTDWSAAYEDAARALLDAWRTDGALERSIPLPSGAVPATWLVGQQYTDMAVHAWDVARGAGIVPKLDGQVVHASLEWGEANLKPEFRGDSFGQAVAVGADAPPLDRLVGFFGRAPDWQPGA